MNLNQIDFSKLASLNLILHGFEILFLLFFLIYALLTLREVSLMNKTLVTPVASGVRIGSLIQLVLALVALGLIFII